MIHCSVGRKVQINEIKPISNFKVLFISLIGREKNITDLNNNDVNRVGRAIGCSL